MFQPISPNKNLKLYAVGVSGNKYPLSLTYTENSLKASLPLQDLKKEEKFYFLGDFTAAKTGEQGYYVLPRTINMTGDIQTFFINREDGEYNYSPSKANYSQNAKYYGDVINSRPIFSSFIVKKDDLNALIRVSSDYNYGYNIRLNGGVYSVSVCLDFAEPDANLPYVDFEFEIFFFDNQADYNDMANFERNLRFSRNELISLKEKCQKYEAVNYAVKYPLVRIRMGWKPSPSPVSSQTLENEPDMYVACSFKRVRDIVDELKKQNVEGAELQLVGWNVSGHDGRFPDLLPADERLGGTDELKKTIDYAKANGYAISLHTNNIDSYQVAESFSWDNVSIGVDGKYLEGGLYSGGQSYRVCPIKQLENAKKLLPEVAKLQPNGLHFIDVVSIVAPDPCYSDKHPSNTRTGIQKAQELIEYASELFGGFSSEGCRDFALKGLCYGLYTSFGNGFGSGKPIFQDRVLPFYEMIIHGVTAYNPVSDTINYTIKSPIDRLTFIMRGSRPSMYYYSKFRTGGEKNWMGESDLVCDTDEQLKYSVSQIKQALDEYKPLCDNQLSFITAYKFIGDDLQVAEYDNGVKIVGNFSEKTAEYNGEKIAPFGYIVIK